MKLDQKDRDSIKFIVTVVVLITIIHIFNVITAGYLSDFGLLPRHFNGFTGIVAYPFLHGSWGHLISNILSFSVLAFLVSRTGIARLIAIFMVSWVGSGLGVWFFGRMHYHIGLSGIIYGLWAYLLMYAIMYRSVKSIAIAILVMFFYGSMIWGFLPTREWISYESHLFGAISGGLAGYLYARRDKRRKESC
ncbi:rhomboid family intramembrane serine protease [Photobacterium sp. DNB23_23_1]